MAYLDAIAERIDYTKNYEAGTKWMYFWNDFISSIKMFKNEENNR